LTKIFFAILFFDDALRIDDPINPQPIIKRLFIIILFY